MSEVHKIQLPAVPADKESGKQIRSQIVASREVFRRMLELQRASFSGYYPDGEESMMQSRQRHQAIKDELDVLRGKAKLHGDDGGPEFKALCEQIHDLKCRQKDDLAPVFPDPSYSQRNAVPLMGDWRAWAA
jgi:hypothetical protein